MNAVRESKPASCSVEEGYKSTAMVQLAMLSHSTGAPVAWDAQKETIVGNAAANKLLKRAYRAPYTHPYPG